MVNYSNGKIYKIISNQTNKIYIGSTTKKYLCDRFYQHNRNYKRWLNKLYHYVTSYEILQYNDAKIILIEKYSCSSKDELHAREQYHIDTNIENCCNKTKAYTGLTRTEYKTQYQKSTKSKMHQNQKYKCVCNGNFTKQNILIHQKTNIHQNYIQTCYLDPDILNLEMWRINGFKKFEKIFN